MQYIPKEGCYIYFRYDNKQTVMVITNTGDKKVKPDWIYYQERVKGFNYAKNVVTGTTTSLGEFEMDAGDSGVFELTQ
jgi:hypothetical protein